MASVAIDLRSDTVTRPSEGMRRAMAEAEVGDDVFCEDPTVRRLEQQVALIVGKAAALFVPSGTMANQLAIMAQTNRGDEIIVGDGAHCAWYETGAAAALSGVQAVAVGKGGLFDADQLVGAIKPAADWYPRARLVAVENTHNRGGGRVWPSVQLKQVVEIAHERGLALHMDGARLWNASVACGQSPSELAAGFDTVSVCFSKGLGAPVGSALCGDDELITRARRFRKMLGGGMRQVGILAAAAIYALEHNRARLKQDHDNAKAIAGELGRVDGARVDLATIDSNIVMVDTPGLAAARVVEQSKVLGVLVSSFGPERIRIVTHLDVATTAVEGGQRVAEAIKRARRAA